ncbi:MAG: hypothetical protein Q8N63_02700 [Nanoarchaeota archaeon]|nr:hypothetical protein [Nanoarchaeota archaeon]
MNTTKKMIVVLTAGMFFVALFVFGAIMPKRLETKSNESEQKMQMLAVMAITYSNNRSFAVIKTPNETRVFQEGETVEGIKITKINKDSVEFEEGNKKWTQTVS